MLLGYAYSPDAQLVVSPALDAAPVLARYPLLMNWLGPHITYAFSVAHGRGLPSD